MSGIEVAGLILGAIPLIISALEHYQSTRETWRNFHHKSLYIDRLIQGLGDQKVLIEADLMLVLRAAGVDQTDIAMVEARDYLTLLRRQDVVEEVAEYLGHIYKHYETALVRCQHCLIDIANNLGDLVLGPHRLKLDPGNLEALAIANARCDGRFQWGPKIRFVLERKGLVERLRMLDESTKMLTRLRTANNSYSEGSIQSNSRTVAKFATVLQKVRTQALILYSAISSGWGRDCHTKHNLELCLEGRLGPLQEKRFPITFDTVLEPVLDRASGQRSRVETQIIMAGDNELPTVSPSSQHSVSSTIPTFLLNTAELPQSPKMEIVDICSFITQAWKATGSTKLYLSGRGRLSGCHHDSAMNIRRAHHLVSSDFVSLEQVLTNLKLKQRMVLSFVLASSLLQLHNTPWLATLLAKDTVYFQRAKSNILGFDVDHPFARHTFTLNTTPETLSKPNAKRSLLELGIILLETWHQVTFESYTTAQAIPLDDTYGRRYDAARKWLDDTEAEILALYSEVVNRCIECSFFRTSTFPEWEEVAFRESVCEGVVKPLLALSQAR